MSNARTLASLIDGSNIVVPSGFGLDFSAKANVSGMTSEILDEYEFGSWTPTMGGQNQPTCYYCKVGRLVMLQGDITLHSSTTTTFLMTGIPFNAAGGTYGTVSVGYVSNSRTAVTGYIYPASDRIDFTTPANLAYLQAGDNIYFTAHFISD